jgi:CheY-like chemotaxis protein
MACLLIVEDDYELRETLAHTLSESGYAVESVSDGSEALARLNAGLCADLILLDLMMPVMNGWQFRARQLANPRLAAIPTIVMTATANLQTAAVSADDFLPKPLRLDQVLGAVARQLSTPSNDVAT